MLNLGSMLVFGGVSRFVFCVKANFSFNYGSMFFCVVGYVKSVKTNKQRKDKLPKLRGYC